MKRALVIGLGKSGQGAIKLLRHLGYEVIGIDQKPCDSDIPVYSDEKIPPGEFKFAILSPGINPAHPVAVELRKKNIPVFGEAELAFRHLKNRCIGVTGTKGKTTLVRFLAHALKGRALGNVGVSLAEYAVNSDPSELLIVELSSFQLETLETRGLDYAVITNIMPDHLDRYASYEDYVQTKYHIQDCLKKGGKLFKWDCYLQLTSNERYWGKLGRIGFKLAVLVCEQFGLSEQDVVEAVKTFPMLPHRLESVCLINEILFVNDSKGTSPEATLYAIHEINRPIILIAGGKNKGLDFETWKEGFKKHVKAVFLIGEMAKPLKNLLEHDYNVQEVINLKDAVSLAFNTAEKGDVVLLSPGCASTDQYQNYEHRGEVFKEHVFQLRRDI